MSKTLANRSLDLCHAIEECGASEPLTAATILACEVCQGVEKMEEEYANCQVAYGMEKTRADRAEAKNSELVQRLAVMESAIAALKGEAVSEFMESFTEVAEAIEYRREQEENGQCEYRVQTLGVAECVNPEWKKLREEHNKTTEENERLMQAIGKMAGELYVATGACPFFKSGYGCWRGCPEAEAPEKCRGQDLIEECWKAWALESVIRENWVSIRLGRNHRYVCLGDSDVGLFRWGQILWV